MDVAVVLYNYLGFRDSKKVPPSFREKVSSPVPYYYKTREDGGVDIVTIGTDIHWTVRFFRLSSYDMRNGSIDLAVDTPTFEGEAAKEFIEKLLEKQ